jgi:uncharacterized protein YggE
MSPAPSHFFLLLIASISLYLAPSLALADHAPPRRTLTVTGKGTVKVTPDMVTVNTGVETQAASAKDALANNGAAMKHVIEVLKEAGIVPEDIQTTTFSVSPRYEDHSDAKHPRIVGYTVLNMVYMQMHDIDKLGTVLDALVSAGANSISISFGLDKPKERENEARKLAIEDAIAKAKLYAEAAGVELGTVQSIREQGGYVPYYPATLIRETASATAIPIEPGEQKVDIQVLVT